MKFLKRILTNDNRYSPENDNYRKVYLLNAVLISFIIITLFFSFINIFTKRNLAIVLTQAGVAIIGACIMLFYRKTNNFLVASYSTLLLLVAFFSIFAIQVKNAYYAMAWIVIAPPIAFFLLGKKGGRNFSLVYILYFSVFIHFGLKQWDPSDVTFSTVLNLMGSVLSLVILIGYYERSKQSVTQGFIDKNAALNKANEELSESRNRLQLILDSTAEALYGIDLDGRCTFCNQSCIRLLGYKSEDDLLGKVIHQISGVSEKACDILCNINNGIYAHGENDVFYKADGEPLDVVYYTYPQFKDGELTGAVVTFLDNSVRKKNEERIKYLSTHDSLTGFYNRSGFAELINDYDTQENLPISVIFCDLNYLKLTNDIFGHRAGDELIQKCAYLLKQGCFECDLIARWGGDEFVVLLPKTPFEKALDIINSVKNALSNEYIRAIKLSMSMGCYTKKEGEESIERVIDNAESNMYKEKALFRKYNSLQMIDSIINVLHEKSPQEKQHSVAVSELCVRIGNKLNLPKTEIKKLKDIGYYHDIGKIILDDKILKDGIVMSDDEITKKHSHSVVGYRILNLFDFTLDLAEGVFSHHERWNGTGYPKGLKGEEIPLLARIVAVAEHYDRITGGYTKNPLTREQALQKINGMAGAHFDPGITDVFIEMMSESE